jgi:predicted PurR-regulated permease PerM
VNGERADQLAADSDSENAKPSAVRQPTIRMPDLLRRPFDIRSVALSGLFVLAVFYTMYFARAVLLPVVLALLLSFLFAPFVRVFARIGIRPHFSAALLLIAVVAMVAYGVSFLAAPAAGWLEKAPYGLQQLQQKLLPLRKPMEQVAKATGEVEKIAAPEGAKPAPVVEVRQHKMAELLYGRTPEVVGSTVLLLILLYFLLAYDGVFLTKVIKMLPRLTDKKRAVSIAHDIEVHVSRYLLTVTLINVCLGIAVGTAVGLLGLPNPIMWGVLVAVLNFVPYLGALTGIICMTIGAVLSYPNVSYALLFPAVYLVIASIEGNFVTPMVMGRSLTLNPVIILLSLTFWGWMWGIAGIIVAVPILAGFKIFCSHIEPMQPIAEFLS